MGAYEPSLKRPINPRHAARPACPQCGSQYVKHLNATRYACKKCEHAFTFVRDDTKRRAGSGIKAGKIEIGRGFKWGAGLV